MNVGLDPIKDDDLGLFIDEPAQKGAEHSQAAPATPVAGADFIDDATAEKTAQKLKRFLQDTEKRMGMLLELMPIGLALHQEQSIVFSNQWLSKLTGLEPEALIGRHCLDFIESEDNYDLFTRFSDVFSGGATLNESNLTIMDAEGGARSVQLVVGRMPWQGPALAQVLIQDVSHIKAMERELHKQSQELASALFAETRAREAQKEFVSVISHEFRTPLAIIDGSAQMIERSLKAAKPDKIPDKTKKIRRAVSRMNGLIDDILASSSAEKSGFTITPADFDFGAFLAERCTQINDTSQSHQIFYEQDNLPPVLRADRKACSHIIDNLLSNAVKYSPNAEKVLVRAWQQEGRLYVAVQDYGVGVPGAEHDKLFGKYFRASTSHGIRGTGIGLNLVKNLLRLQGGDVAVESSVGEGSIFTIYLPIETDV
jgi:PAS domain S-box-containing protein